MKIPLSFYQRIDTLKIAQELLGKELFTRNEIGEITSGVIVETEAYCGAEDKACHASANKKTKRNAVMFETGGISYVYLCYGLHHLFNIVTHQENEPHAILIRAIEPQIGIEIMQKRRNLKTVDKRLTGGPAILTQALNINLNHNGINLTGDEIWLEENLNFQEEEIIKTTRIGIDYAKEYKDKPWRFYVKGNKFVSNTNKSQNLT